MGYVKRASVMLKAADLVAKDKFLISAILAHENGKTRMEAVADVDEGIDFLRYYALNLIENQGFVRFTGKGYDNEESVSYMKPYGIFAVIAPFNFYAITAGMVAGPLVTGNAVILKPSSNIPLSSYLYIKTLYEAGVPRNALAFISGKGSVIGPYIVSHRDISGVLFTGSRQAGIDIFKNATRDRPKVVITEMGGKDTIIVTNKAKLEKSVNGVYRAAFGYSGQKCSACSIAYVEEGIYDDFVKKIKEVTDTLKLDDPRRKDTYLGPVINEESVEKFRDAIERARKEGKILSGGTVLDKPGFYVQPTLVTDLPQESYIVQNELFLPLLAIVKVKSLDDAISRVNKSDYGLTGGIFTEDPSEIQKYFDEAEVGVIYANRERGGSTGAMVGSQPFVGWKLSGISGKGTGSFYYLQQFLREQSQTIAH
jgi:1-pyrroline-5-carboxylate dehydrogenase